MTGHELEFGESVTVEPGDLGQAMKALAALQDTSWVPHTDLVTALVQDEQIIMPATLLWRLTELTDPAAIYDLDESEAATYEREDVKSHLRLEAAFYRQASRTAAAVLALMDAEVTVLAARWRPLDDR